MSKVIAIASGKGGAGKTTLALNLSIALSGRGNRVCLLDADTGLTNVDNLLNVYPPHTIADIFADKKNLDEVMYKGPSDIDIIPGGNGVNELTQAGNNQLNSLIDKFDKLSDYDMVIVDTSSGITPSNLPFLRAADTVATVVTPDSNAINEGLAILKILHLNQYKGEMFVLPNKFKSKDQVEHVVNKILNVTRSSFNGELNILPPIMDDSNIHESTVSQKPVMVDKPDSLSASEILKVADQMRNLASLTSGLGAGSYIHRVASFASDTSLSRLLQKYLENKAKKAATGKKVDKTPAKQKEEAPSENGEDDLALIEPKEEAHVEIVEDDLLPAPSSDAEFSEAKATEAVLMPEQPGDEDELPEDEVKTDLASTSPMNDEFSPVESVEDDVVPGATVVIDMPIETRKELSANEKQNARVVELLERIVGSLEKNTEKIMKLEGAMDILSRDISKRDFITPKKALPAKKKVKSLKPKTAPSEETSFLMEVTEYSIPGAEDIIVPPPVGVQDTKGNNMVNDIIRKRGGPKFKTLTNDELRIADALLRSDAINENQFCEFADLRYKFDTEGKDYLGDILLERKLITEDILKEFLKLNNKGYKKFCSVLRDQGLINKDQFQEIMSDKKSEEDIIAVIDEQKVMSRDDFMKLFDSVSRTPKFGEWLIHNEHVEKSDIHDALKEQGINSFEDYLIYNKLVDRDVLDKLKYRMGLN